MVPPSGSEVAVLAPARAKCSAGRCRCRRGGGRERQARWGARGLDLDLLACGQRVCPDPATQRRWIDLAPERRSREVPGALILPHPRLQERAFVLGPLRDICPDWQHPVLQQTVEQLYDSLPKGDIAAIRPL